MYLCVLCGSQNKQRLFPYTALTDWFYNLDGECLLRGTGWNCNYNLDSHTAQYASNAGRLCTSTQMYPIHRQYSVTMRPSKHKTQPKRSISHLCSIHQQPHFPSPYLRHFPNVVPCLETTFYQKDEWAPSTNIYRNKSHPSP